MRSPEHRRLVTFQCGPTARGLLATRVAFQNASGLIGIGTTNPTAKLHVQLTTANGTNALNSIIALNNSTPLTGITSAMNLVLYDYSTASTLSKQTMRLGYVRDASATGASSDFDSLLTAATSISSNTPYPIRSINVEGPNVAAGKTLASFYGIYIGAGSGTVTTKTALATQAGAGNVGINTLTPTAQLEVAGNAKISGAGNGLLFPDGSKLTSASTMATGVNLDNSNSNPGNLTSGAITFGSAATEGIASRRTTDVTGTLNQNGLDFYTSSTARLSIKNNGFVGIGTKNPLYPLDVAGDINTSGNVTSAALTTGLVFATGVTVTGSNIFAISGATTSTEAQSAGVYGTGPYAGVWGQSGDAGYAVVGTNSGSGIGLYGGSISGLALKTSGPSQLNGTTSVVGDANVSGNSTVSGNMTISGTIAAGAGGTSTPLAYGFIRGDGIKSVGSGNTEGASRSCSERSMRLRPGLPLLQRVHRRQGAGAGRPAHHARARLRGRTQLRAIAQVGAVRAPLCRHRRSRAAGRADAGRAVRLRARLSLDRAGRGARRLRARLHGAGCFHAAQGTVAGGYCPH
jgi:hypothetical protein